MLKIIYVASSNPGKLRDFAVAASAHDIAIHPLPGLADIPAPPEDAPTFAGNARDKAQYYSRFLPGQPVLSDDSGLEVDALGGDPGVRSARYAADAGFHAGANADANNNLFLLEQLAAVAEKDRGARYQCALSIAVDGQETHQAEGTVGGAILLTPRGQGGFGYDPLFYVPTLGQTMAEICPVARWELSHRGQAFRTLLDRFKT